MRIKKDFYTSYKTHSYCKSCTQWHLKTVVAGLYCPNCNKRLRLNARFTGAKAERWALAY